MTNLYLLNFYELIIQLLANFDTEALLSLISGVVQSVPTADLCVHIKHLSQLAVEVFTRLDLTNNLIEARKVLSGTAGIYAVVCTVTGTIYIGSVLLLIWGFE